MRKGTGLIAVPKTVADLVALQSRDHRARGGNDVMSTVLTAHSRIQHRVEQRHLIGDAGF
jgi:ubiquinone biosynthesis protein COQ9